MIQATFSLRLSLVSAINQARQTCGHKRWRHNQTFRCFIRFLYYKSEKRKERWSLKQRIPSPTNSPQKMSPPPFREILLRNLKLLFSCWERKNIWLRRIKLHFLLSFSLPLTISPFCPSLQTFMFFCCLFISPPNSLSLYLFIYRTYVKHLLSFFISLLFSFSSNLFLLLFSLSLPLFIPLFLWVGACLFLPLSLSPIYPFSRLILDRLFYVQRHSPPQIFFSRLKKDPKMFLFRTFLFFDGLTFLDPIRNFFFSICSIFFRALSEFDRRGATTKIYWNIKKAEQDRLGSTNFTIKSTICSYEQCRDYEDCCSVQDFNFWATLGRLAQTLFGTYRYNLW